MDGVGQEFAHEGFRAGQLFARPRILACHDGGLGRDRSGLRLVRGVRDEDDDILRVRRIQMDRRAQQLVVDRHRSFPETGQDPAQYSRHVAGRRDDVNAPLAELRRSRRIAAQGVGKDRARLHVGTESRDRGPDDQRPALTNVIDKGPLGLRGEELEGGEDNDPALREQLEICLRVADDEAGT